MTVVVLSCALPLGPDLQRGHSSSRTDELGGRCAAGHGKDGTPVAPLYSASLALAGAASGGDAPAPSSLSLPLLLLLLLLPALVVVRPPLSSHLHVVHGTVAQRMRTGDRAVNVAACAGHQL